MAWHCQQCGVELFAGQQFCRRCGTPTALRQQRSEQPTQIFDADRQTFDHSGRATANVNAASTGGFIPASAPPEAYAQTFNVPQAPAPRRRRRAGLWVWAIIFAGVVVLASVAATLYAVNERRQLLRQQVVKRVKVEAPAAPAPAPKLPGAGGVLVRDEAGEQDSDSGFTRTFPLGAGASVSLKNLSGKVRIEGWDEGRAEVKVSKRGGTAEQRRAVKVISQVTGDQLSLQTDVPKGTDSGVEVEYEIKVPRGAKRVEVSSMNSDVELSNLNGAVSVNLFNGRIELSEVGGPVNTKSVNGNVSVELSEAALKSAGPSQINLVKGDVELKLPEGLRAHVSADVVTGSIEADESLGLKIEKRTIGQHAEGQVGGSGSGSGQSFAVKIVTGKITITD